MLFSRAVCQCYSYQENTKKLFSFLFHLNIPLMFGFSFDDTQIDCCTFIYSYFKIKGLICILNPHIPAWCWAVLIPLSHRSRNWDSECDFLSMLQYIWGRIERTIQQLSSWFFWLHVYCEAGCPLELLRPLPLFLQEEKPRFSETSQWDEWKILINMSVGWCYVCLKTKHDLGIRIFR